MVSPASRISSAISFGVFCRFARFDQADDPVEERLAGIGRDAHDNPIGENQVPPVTELRSPRSPGSPARFPRSRHSRPPRRLPR